MTQNILIIDDNEADQFLCEYAIQDYDATIDISKASDGKQALALLDQADHIPDLIFLDINMPGMNGFEFLEALNQSDYTANNIVVMLTSSIREDDHLRCDAYSMVKRIISKPLNRQLFIECLSD